MKLERIGNYQYRELDLYLLEADTFEEIPNQVPISSKYHIALVICDCLNSSNENISFLLNRLLQNGARYFIGWGANSEKIDDLADWEVIADGRFEHNEDIVMTAWIDDQPIEEAIFFTFYCAFPSDKFLKDCKSVLAVCVNDSDTANKIRTVFNDVDKWINEYVGD